MSYNFKDVKVLVVESSPQLFELVRSVLNMFSIPLENVYSAYSIDEGFRQFCAENHDMVMIDWLQNPDRGIQLTHLLRRHDDSPNPFVPIIMTAGSGHLSRVYRARDAGISDYLVKPFSAKQLAKKITRIIESPKPFVVAPSYVGPDRRAAHEAYPGRERRENAISAVPVGFRQPEAHAAR